MSCQSHQQQKAVLSGVHLVLRIPNRCQRAQNKTDSNVSNITSVTVTNISKYWAIFKIPKWMLLKHHITFTQWPLFSACFTSLQTCAHWPVLHLFCPSQPQWDGPTVPPCTCMRCSSLEWQLSKPGGPHLSQGLHKRTQNIRRPITFIIYNSHSKKNYWVLCKKEPMQPFKNELLSLHSCIKQSGGPLPTLTCERLCLLRMLLSYQIMLLSPIKNVPNRCFGSILQNT